MPPTIDARGLACPAPVLLVKEAIETQAPATIQVLVDNEASRENVSRFLASRGYGVAATVDGSGFVLAASRTGGEAAVAEPAPAVTRPAGQQKIMVLIAGERMGVGDELLGGKLMLNFIRTLKEMGSDLWHLVFLNSGVRLTISSSPVLAELQEYERNGVVVLACGTCLEHYGLTAVKAVGGSTNMLDIVTACQLADKVITLG